MTLHLNNKYGLSLRKQSLDERFSALSVSFVKEVLKTLMEEKLRELYPVGFLSDFNKVKIKDSTKFKVPSCMEDEFKGCGGSEKRSFEAGISIQYEYDLKTGMIEDLNITSANRPDQRDARETMDKIRKDDLIIRDLGYFGLPVLGAIIEQEAYFLSRLNPSTAVFDDKEESISFKKIYRQMKRSGSTQMELSALIGQNEKMPVRLVIMIVPENVYEKRIQEKERKSKNRGCKTSEETKMRYRFNLFITNIEQACLSKENVYILYKLRWQIELVFKYWKSIFRIDKVHKMKKNRYLCMIYTKLILIVINLQMIYRLQENISRKVDQGCWEKGDGKNKVYLLSIRKCLKTLRYYFLEWYEIIRTGIESTKKIGKKIEVSLSENHWFESKKNKICLPEIIDVFICKSNK